MPIPKPNKNENQNDFLKRCTPELYPEYNDQRQAVAICIDAYEKAHVNASMVEKVKMKMVGMEVMNEYRYIANEGDKIMNERGIRLAEEGGGSYPWDECIADQEARYGDEETAKKVCGYIKSEYGN